MLLIREYSEMDWNKKYIHIFVCIGWDASFHYIHGFPSFRIVALVIICGSDRPGILQSILCSFLNSGSTFRGKAFFAPSLRIDWNQFSILFLRMRHSCFSIRPLKYWARMRKSKAIWLNLLHSFSFFVHTVFIKSSKNGFIF